MTSTGPITQPPTCPRCGNETRRSGAHYRRCIHCQTSAAIDVRAEKTGIDSRYSMRWRMTV